MSDELPGRVRLARRMIPWCAVGLLWLALVPWWGVVLPRLDFDVDPRSLGAGVVTTLGPAGFGWLALVGTLVAGLGLLVHGLAGGRFAWKSALLLLPGVWGLGVWMPERFEHLWQGTGWLWGASAGLAAVHLGRWPSARRWASAVLAGFAAMLLVEALNYRLVEHPATVAMFESQREVILEARGWAAGSSEALLYERRLRTNDAVGAIGLSNVLATLAAGLGVMGLGLAVGSLRPRRGVAVEAAARKTLGGSAGWRGLVGCGVFAMGAGVVAMTNSTGGMAALGLGCAWVTGVLLIRAVGAWRGVGVGGGAGVGVRYWLGGGAVLGVLMVYGAVGLRTWGWGVPGAEAVGEGIGGELSVLFRGQYWGAGWRMVTASWERGLVGYGPGGFGDGYLVFKDALNPEEVTSAHGFAVDFVVALGVLGGGLWLWVLLGWLWRGAAGSVELAGDQADDSLGGGVGLRGVGYGLLLVGGGWVGLELWLAWAELAGPGAAWGLGWRLAAWGGFVLVGLGWWRFAGDGGIRLGLVGAALAVLVHGSFDMGWFQPTSAVALWLLVGLCGGAGERDEAAGFEAVRPALEEWAWKWRWPSSRVGWTHGLAAAAVLSPWAVSYVPSAAGAAWRWSAYSASLGAAASAVREGSLEVARERLLKTQASVGFDRVALRWVGQLTAERAMGLLAGGDTAAALEVWEEGVMDFWAALADLDEPWDARRSAVEAAADGAGDGVGAAWEGTPRGVFLEWPTSGGLSEMGTGWGWKNAGMQRVLGELYGGWRRALLDSASGSEVGLEVGSEAGGLEASVVRGVTRLWLAEQAAWSRAKALSPTNVEGWVRLADVTLGLAVWHGVAVGDDRAAALQGEAAAMAADWYREALRLDGLRYLDAAKQMPEPERVGVEAWLRGYEGRGSAE